MRRETREIAAPKDFELGREREVALKYRISWQDKGPTDGIVFVIPGFGDDGASEYSQKLRDHVAGFGYLAVSVDYHCLGARPATGGRLVIDADEHMRLLGIARMMGAQIEDVKNLDQVTRAVGAAGPLIRGHIEPARGEYQNFGILQAMDHLAVLGDLKARGPAFDAGRIIAFGSSHGGYIAHLMAKIAPRSLSAVLDNSSYTQPPFNYLGLGIGGEYLVQLNGVKVECAVVSGWSLKSRQHANAYTRDADLIRDTAHPPHVDAMRAAAGETGPLFRMANAATDPISPPEKKRRQARVLQCAGFDARLDVIGQEGLDGVVFKSLTHGLDASLKSLFEHWADAPGARRGELDCERQTSMDYPCVDSVYRFRHTQSAPYIEGEIEDMYAL